MNLYKMGYKNLTFDAPLQVQPWLKNKSLIRPYEINTQHVIKDFYNYLKAQKSNLLFLIVNLTLIKIIHLILFE